MTTAATPERVSRMTLASVQKGVPPAPDRLLIVGTEGVGKSTFGAAAPNPIFIAAEDGLRHLTVDSFPEPHSLQDVKDAIRSLAAGGHNYENLVIDTLDWLEPLLWADLCRRNDWKDIEAPGYGKGYVAALDDWRALLASLDALRAKGMGVILLAHAQIKLFNNPAGPDFSRYELALHRGAAALCKQWCDAVLFAAYEEFTVQKNDKVKAKATSTGRRILHTQRTAAWDAKNRFSLPATLPLDYDSYAAARAAGPGGQLGALRADYAALLEELNPTPELRAKITAAAGDLKNPLTLARVVNRLRALLAEKE